MKQHAPFAATSPIQSKAKSQAKKGKEKVTSRTDNSPSDGSFPPCPPSSASSSSSPPSLDGDVGLTEIVSLATRQSMEALLNMTNHLQLAPTVNFPSPTPTQGAPKIAVKGHKTKSCQDEAQQPRLKPSDDKVPSRRCLPRRSSWYNPKAPWDDDDDERITPTRARSDDVFLHNMMMAMHIEDNVAFNLSEHAEDNNEPARRTPLRTRSADTPLYKISKEDTPPE